MKYPTRIERLEDRLAPAGIVLATYDPQTHELMITDGDDILVVGEDSEDNLVRFFRDVTADGGDGSDTRNGITLDNEFVSPAIFNETGFEILLPRET